MRSICLETVIILWQVTRYIGSTCHLIISSDSVATVFFVLKLRNNNDHNYWSKVVIWSLTRKNISNKNNCIPAGEKCWGSITTPDKLLHTAGNASCNLLSHMRQEIDCTMILTCVVGGGETVDVGLSVDQVLGLPHHIVHGGVEATITHRYRSHGTCLQQIIHR